MVILPSIELYMGCTDAEQNIDCLMLICCGTLGLLKMILFRIYANNLIDNYESALNDYMAMENVKQRAIMRRHAFIGRILCCSMMCFSYFSCVIYALIPLLGNDKKIPINVTNEVVVREYTIPSRCALEYFNPPNTIYRIVCCIEAIALILATSANIGNIYSLFNVSTYIFVSCIHAIE